MYFSHCYLPKCMQNLLYGKIKRNFQKVVFWVFEHVRQQNAKKYENHPIGENKISLRKTCILRVFELLTFKKGKNNENTNNINKKRLFWEILILLRIKSPKSKKSTIYRETKIQYKEHVLWVFFIFSTKTRKHCNTTVYQETKERLLWVYIILFGG